MLYVYGVMIRLFVLLVGKLETTFLYKIDISLDSYWDQLEMSAYCDGDVYKLRFICKVAKL